MRTTVTIRRGALLAAAAMACAAVGPPTQAFDLIALARDALPGALVSSAYPFDPWATPVHLPAPGDLALPPAPPPPPGPGPTDPANPIGTGTGALPGSDLGLRASADRGGTDLLEGHRHLPRSDTDLGGRDL